MLEVDIEYSKNQRATCSVWRAEEQGLDDDKVWVVEEADAIAKTTESTMPEKNSWLKKRRQTRSSLEQLDDRDEKAYAEEEHVCKHRDLEDASYKESSSPLALVHAQVEYGMWYSIPLLFPV
jgi:hypothetical protein